MPSDILNRSYERAARLQADLIRLKAEVPVSAPASDHLSGLETAIVQAAQFLEREFHEAEGWISFFRLVNGSRDWVTAYVGWSLLHSRVAQSEVIDQAGALLERDGCLSGGWGYRPGIPIDVDSTSWAAKFLMESGYRLDSSKVKEIILAHQDPVNGGFRTYRSPETGIRDYINAKATADMSGWCSAHLCVTGAAIQALCALGLPPDSEPIQRALTFVREQQSPAGYWNAYWFYGKNYGTRQAIRVLQQLGNADDAVRLTRAREWLEGAQLGDGSWDSGVSQQVGRVFDTALAVCALLDVPEAPQARIQRGIDWLLQRQCPDGGWDSEPILLVPEPSEHAPWKVERWAKWGWTGVCIPDENRIFTTATVLQALTAWNSLLVTRECRTHA
jgi:squalene cyclase